MTTLLFERRTLDGRSFLTVGGFRECPTEEEFSLLTLLLGRCIAAHGGWSNSYATVPARVDGRSRYLEYALLTVSENAVLVRLGSPQELRTAVEAGWPVLRPLVLCTPSVEILDPRDFLKLDRQTEVPSARLLAATTFIALRWFHPWQVDLYSTSSPVSELVDVLESVASSLGCATSEVHEHF